MSAATANIAPEIAHSVGENPTRLDYYFVMTGKEKMKESVIMRKMMEQFLRDLGC
jgi:hypothetical protein